jgi:hypothetical protein
MTTSSHYGNLSTGAGVAVAKWTRCLVGTVSQRRVSDEPCLMQLRGEWRVALEKSGLLCGSEAGRSRAANCKKEATVSAKPTVTNSPGCHCQTMLSKGTESVIHESRVADIESARCSLVHALTSRNNESPKQNACPSLDLWTVGCVDFQRPVWLTAVVVTDHSRRISRTCRSLIRIMKARSN